MKKFGRTWALATLCILFCTAIISFMGYFVPSVLGWLNLIFVGGGFIGFRH